LAQKLASSLDYLEEGEAPTLVVIEAIADLVGTPADGSVLDLVKAARRAGHLLIAENETSGWSGGWGAASLNEVKAGRRGLLLQPDPMDGENLLKTPLTQLSRDVFPPGRGVYVSRGKVVKVQLPWVARVGGG
jgi:S-DNA-T family DNA segregation ATPase FtsK/SpoIIIE